MVKLHTVLASVQLQTLPHCVEICEIKSQIKSEHKRANSKSNNERLNGRVSSYQRATPGEKKITSEKRQQQRDVKKKNEMYENYKQFVGMILIKRCKRTAGGVKLQLSRIECQTLAKLEFLDWNNSSKMVFAIIVYGTQQTSERTKNSMQLWDEEKTTTTTKASKRDGNDKNADSFFTDRLNVFPYTQGSVINSTTLHDLLPF